MINLCAPAIIYLIFSITQILIDIFKGMYNTAFMKVIVMVLVTLLLNILCEKGLSVVSWVIVFIPFIMMTVIVSMLLYIFGLNASTGKLNYNSDTTNTNAINGVTVDSLGNIYISDQDNQRIRKIDLSNNVTTIAGSGSAGFSDGNGINAYFNNYSPN